MPSCPGWKMSDLVEHIAMVQRWAAGAVHNGAAERPRRAARTTAPAGPELLSSFREASNPPALSTLKATDPEQPPFLDLDLGAPRRYWARRQAQEVAVHRWDAQHARGAPEPIEAALAADGVDELFELTRARGNERFAGKGQTVHLHCTDTTGAVAHSPGAAGGQLETCPRQRHRRRARQGVGSPFRGVGSRRAPSQARSR